MNGRDHEDIEMTADSVKSRTHNPGTTLNICGDLAEHVYLSLDGCLL